MRRLLCVLLALLLASPANAAIIPSIPYNLTNGSLADATQVMGNFNTIVTDVNTNSAHSGANSDITSILGLTTPLSVAQGGTALYTGGTTAGTANAQTLATVSPSNFTLTAGNYITAKAGASNTGATSLNVHSTGVTAMRKQTAAGLVALTGGEIISGSAYTWIYDGTYYQLLNPTIATNIVTGPGSAVSGHIATFNGTSGTVIQDSGIASSVIATLAPLASPALTGTPTAPTAAAGTATTQLATTAFAAGALTAGTSGSATFPNGLIIKWGSAPAAGVSASPATISFPVAFPNACFNVSLTLSNATSYGALDSGYTTVASVSASQFTTVYTAGWYWIAIGD